MASMDNIKKRIIISMCAIVLLIITLIGITYAYFTTNVRGNKEDKSITVTAGSLKLEYNGKNSYIEVTGLEPGTTIESKKFSVKNTGTREVLNYDVILENVVNELKDYKDLTYVLECTSSDGTECNGNSGIFPKSQQVIATNSINPNVEHSYILTLTYTETYQNQSNDMNKEISAKVNIKDDVSNIKKLNIYGNSIQDTIINGEPSIDNPVKIENLGVKTKNLFDGNLNPGGYINEYGDIVNNASYVYSELIEVKSSSSYVFSAINTVTGEIFEKSIHAYDANGNYIKELSKISISTKDKYILSITTPEDCKYLKVSLNSKDKDIQIENGTEVTQYKPYGYEIPINIDGNIVNVYLNEPLRKVGNSADYLDYENSRVVRNIKVINDTGALLLENSYSELETSKLEVVDLPLLNINENSIITICSNNTVCASNIEVEFDK